MGNYFKLVEETLTILVRAPYVYKIPARWIMRSTDILALYIGKHNAEWNDRNVSVQAFKAIDNFVPLCRSH